MSLPTSQQRVLDHIEAALKKREPRLAGMFAMFTQLTHGEGLPRTEVLQRVPWWSPRRHRIRPPTRAAMLLSLAIILVVSALFISMSASNPNCPASLAAHGPVMVQTHAKNCPALPGGRAMGMGHGP
jgi:hypothetical protein